MKNLVLFFCLLHMTISCAQKQASEEFLGKKIPSVLLSVDPKIEFQWPSTITVEEVIYLETTDESILSRLDKVFVSPDEQIIVTIDLTLRKAVIFDQHGNILRVLDKKGQGPNEYLTYDRCVCEF
ncbi:6-bladed beta-propeller [Mongoliitalea daihaiensis]|uniref:6-bladed beta-propeller n=1 Tax=Mongoliitalea daihaiensis TaxID=2782006 RepID=UPI0021D40541|nr:6-bladed beta-propeller [Mongoliitalea daihaiensis]UJP65191.1 6-bladed beta-propeller [Mongoliitalea daihaiensis]